jgi:ribonuclease HII
MKQRVAAGIDEVGRGPLAGPIIACAVIFSPKTKSSKIPSKLRDSKKLSAKQREKYYQLFLKHPNIQWGIGKITEKTIDRINIYQATKLAMERAVHNLSRKIVPGFLYIDGIMEINVSIPQKTMVRGDETIQLCAMASIIAKVTRDRFMMNYHKKYPHYGFNLHKGYGTRLHIAMLKKYGPCSIHRKSFSPINSLVN